MCADFNTNTLIGPSFSLKNRLIRLIWTMVYFLCFRFSPRPFHNWRNFILKIFHANIGHHVHVYPSAKIWAPWNLTLKDYACIGDDCRIYNQAPITIGKKSILSQNNHLCTGTHDYQKSGFPLIAYPITIKDHVWIASDSFIGPNVTIETGCVVGARSVVVKNLPEWSICVGHPCKPIKKRPFLC